MCECIERIRQYTITAKQESACPSSDRWRGDGTHTHSALAAITMQLRKKATAQRQRRGQRQAKERSTRGAEARVARATLRFKKLEFASTGRADKPSYVKVYNRLISAAQGATSPRLRQGGKK
jgi:hypothetical protein